MSSVNDLQNWNKLGKRPPGAGQSLRITELAARRAWAIVASRAGQRANMEHFSQWYSLPVSSPTGCGLPLNTHIQMHLRPPIPAKAASQQHNRFRISRRTVARSVPHSLDSRTDRSMAELFQPVQCLANALPGFASKNEPFRPVYSAEHGRLCPRLQSMVQQCHCSKPARLGWHHPGQTWVAGRGGKTVTTAVGFLLDWRRPETTGQRAQAKMQRGRHIPVIAGSKSVIAVTPSLPNCKTGLQDTACRGLPACANRPINPLPMRRQYLSPMLPTVCSMNSAPQPAEALMRSRWRLSFAAGQTTLLASWHLLPARVIRRVGLARSEMDRAENHQQPGQPMAISLVTSFIARTSRRRPGWQAA